MDTVSTSDTVCMNEFTCKRCGYSTKHKHVLLKHLQRINVCEPKLESIDVNDLLKNLEHHTSKPYLCTSCGKGFSHDSSLSRHKKKCVVKTDPINEQLSQPNECQNIKDDNKDLIIEDLKEKIAIMEKQLQLLQSRQHQTNITENNNVTINNAYVVVLNNFGSEDVSHVIEDKSFLDKCIVALHNGIPNVVKKIWYDESKPENKTVLIKSVKRKTAIVHTDGRWEETDLNQVVPIMVRKGSRILSNHLMTKYPITGSDGDKEEIINAKQGYIANVLTNKKPEADIVSSAVKASIYNYKAK